MEFAPAIVLRGGMVIFIAVLETKVSLQKQMEAGTEPTEGSQDAE